MSLTYRQAMTQANISLKENNIEDFQYDCRQLAMACSHFDETNLYVHLDEECNEEFLIDFTSKVKRRISGEPLQYILGSWTFYGRELLIGKGVLIPRPETEQLFLMADREVKKRKGCNVIDLCTGSGCVGLSLAAENPDCQVWISDISEDALFWAKKNAVNLSLKNVNIIQYDIFNGFNKNIFTTPDVLTANPPYIKSSEIDSLQREISFEPRLAFDGGSDGLDFYRCLCSYWLPSLNQGGYFAFETGEDQSESILTMIDSNLYDANITNDIFSAERFVSGVKL